MPFAKYALSKIYDEGDIPLLNGLNFPTNGKPLNALQIETLEDSVKCSSEIMNSGGFKKNGSDNTLEMPVPEKFRYMDESALLGEIERNIKSYFGGKKIEVSKIIGSN